MHTIIPGMIAQNGVPLVTFGVMGGQMQPQGHLQLVCNLVDFNMDVQSALDAPRFRVVDGSTVTVEEGVPMNVQAGIGAKGTPIATTVFLLRRRTSYLYPSGVQYTDRGL